MKTTKPIYLSLLVLTGTMLGARGGDFRTDINPALLYYRAFVVYTEPVPEADRDYLSSKKGKEQKLPERFGKIVAASDNQFFLVRRAAQMKVPCDWGIDLADGPNVMLPYLGRAKALSQTGQLRAVWALQHGRQTDARDDLLGAFVMGRNAANDGLLISAFVQDTIESIEYTTMAQFFGEFSPETLKQLVDGFDAAPPRHTIASTMPTEKSLGDWVSHKILELRKAYPDDDARVMAGFRDSGMVQAMEFSGVTNFWTRLLAASGGTSEGILKLINESGSYFPRVTEIMALPPAEYESQSKQLMAEIEKSPNPFLTSLTFIFGRHQQWGFRAREFKAQAQAAMVRAAVEYKLHGESGLNSVMDPFGKGPFAFRRFVFKGVDRGFELKSAYTGGDAPFVLIFVEKQGPAFQISGAEAGKAVTQ